MPINIQTPNQALNLLAERGFTEVDALRTGHDTDGRQWAVTRIGNDFCAVEVWPDGEVNTWPSRGYDEDDEAEQDDKLIDEEFSRFVDDWANRTVMGG